jgi:hypothetical protein
VKEAKSALQRARSQSHGNQQNRYHPNTGQQSWKKAGQQQMKKTQRNQTQRRGRTKQQETPNRSEIKKQKIGGTPDAFKHPPLVNQQEEQSPMSQQFFDSLEEFPPLVAKKPALDISIQEEIEDDATVEAENTEIESGNQRKTVSRKEIRNPYMRVQDLPKLVDREFHTHQRGNFCINIEPSDTYEECQENTKK